MSYLDHGRTKGEGCGQVKSISAPVIFYLPLQGGASAMVYYFCHCMSLHVCPDENFSMDSRLANFWERIFPFGFLLVVPLL